MRGPSFGVLCCRGFWLDRRVRAIRRLRSTSRADTPERSQGAVELGGRPVRLWLPMVEPLRFGDQPLWHTSTNGLGTLAVACNDVSSHSGGSRWRLGLMTPHSTTGTAMGRRQRPHIRWGVPMSEVLIVGAGLAGLACAQDLTRAGVACTVLEASDGVGGRVRTDVVDGFLLDRGFQILLTAYPEVQGRLDVAALEVGLFEPGAAIRRRGRFHRVSDPLRRPLGIPGTVSAPIGTLADKVRLVRLVLDVRRHTVGELLRRPDTTTAERLARAGFSDRMMESFWQPLFAGIQLDPDLEVSSRGSTRSCACWPSVPRVCRGTGMGMIPAQLASTLPDQSCDSGPVS